MPADQFTLKERAVLLALMAEARPLTNAELYAVAGVKLEGESRRRLNHHKLVDTEKQGRSFRHELTEQGWRWCGEEEWSELPPRAGSAGGALFVVLAGLKRYRDRTGVALSELFHPDLELRIRAAYRTLAAGSGWVGLARLREHLEDVPRDELDQALLQLADQPEVSLQGETNQQALTESDRAGALQLGGADRHLLKIEER